MFAASKGTSGSGGKGKKGPAWLGAGGPKATKQKSAAQWKPRAASEHDPEVKKKPARFFVTVAALLLIAGFIYYLFTPPLKTQVIVFRAGTYPLRMPPMALAAEDEELLGKVNSNVRVRPLEFKSDKPADSLGPLKNTLNSAGRSFTALQWGPKAVIVYVAAHGVVDEEGNACLVPSNADPFDRKTWLPLADVLTAIAEESSLKERDKLVLLDCQRQLSCWRSGWLENRFFDAVSSVLKGQSDPRLFVIASGDNGEINWAAPELRGSVFGHFVARALQGAAAPKSDTVDVLDFYNYVAKEVSNYSQTRRGVSQMPVLFAQGAVFRFGQEELSAKLKNAATNAALCYVGSQKGQDIKQIWSEFDPVADFGGGTAKPGAAGSARSLKDQVQELWEAYARREQPRGTDASDRALPGYVLDPVGWSSIQQRIAAIGERLLAGKQYQTPELAQHVAGLIHELQDEERWKPHGKLPGLSLPQVAVSAPVGTAAAVRKNAFQEYAAAEPDKKAEKIPRGLKRDQALRDVYDDLTKPGPGGSGRARLALAVEFLQKAAPAEPAADFIEGHFLTLLHAGLPADAALSPERLAATLKMRQLAELVATPADKRVHYGIESLVKAADEKRRRAEDGLYVLVDPIGQPAAESAVYDEAQSRSRQLAEFLRLRDEVWADLPRLAEWRIVQARLAGETPPVESLRGLIGRAVELDRLIDVLLKAREEAGTFASSWEPIETAFRELDSNWKRLKGDLAIVYQEATKQEGQFHEAASLRDAEIALKQVPLAGDLKQLIERQLATLVATPRDDKSAGSTQRKITGPGQVDGFFSELQRVLDYGFVVPYQDYNANSLWTANTITVADTVFRTSTATAARVGVWSRLEGLLDDYTAAIREESLQWGASKPAYGASARVRQWDRRIRVSSAWLNSFEPFLRQTSEANARGDLKAEGSAIGDRKYAARWLQRYDAAHTTAWHAQRALLDFWGNGKAEGAGERPFFASAISRCNAAMDEWRPLRYDVPGGGLISFSEQDPAALSALAKWNPVSFPGSFEISSGGESNPRVQMAVQANNDQALKIPEGTAALRLAAQSGALPPGVRITFDASGDKRAEAIKLPVQGNPQPATAIVERTDAANAGPSVDLEARLWYRGHVRARPYEGAADAAKYVEYRMETPKYPAPSVEVNGTDTIRGAVMFVFDCSRSMQGTNLQIAQRELNTVLERLWNGAGSSLKVGLMAYGTRTDVAKREYARTSRRESPALSPAGQAAQQRLPNFTTAYPHPDGDIETLLSLLTGNAQQAQVKLKTIDNTKCLGFTPLYHAATKAIEAIQREASDQGAKRVVIVSDGVNMPYDTDYYDNPARYEIGRTGVDVDQADYQALESALSRAQDVKVTLQIFGGRTTKIERDQFQQLQRLQQNHPNFELREVQPQQIANDIIQSFPKTKVELSPIPGGSSAQVLALNAQAVVREWDSPNVLRKDYLPRMVRLALPGEERWLERPLQLLGGERVQMSYDAGGGSLTFDDDGSRERDSKPIVVPAGGKHKELRLDALDPEYAGSSVRKLRFRLRHQDASTSFAPRPKYVWLEFSPRNAGGEAESKVFPCLDATWLDFVNLPRLEAPVQNWPDAPRARVQAYFLMDEQLPVLETAKVPRDAKGQTLTVERESWRIANEVNDTETSRTIEVVWEPTERGGIDKLLERAVWLSPAPQVTQRRFLLDGSKVIHQFTYTNPELVRRDIEVQVVSKAEFQRRAYSTLDFEFSVAK